MFLLDTDICSEAVMGNPRVLSRVRDCDPDSWAISALVYAELQFGLEKGQLITRSREALEKFLHFAPMVPFDGDAARQAAIVRAELERVGRPSGQVDYFIAGHARSLGATLVTGNTRHFEAIGGLRLENWDMPVA
jgi:tRNA(fMet)-specific endonuclease VapC